MLRKIVNIQLILLTFLVLFSCNKTEVLESYQEIKEDEPTALSFSPYVGSASETAATTRADLSYLTGLYGSNYESYLTNFNGIPYLGQSTGNNGSNQADYRFGREANNAYIVGLYGFYHGDDDTKKWNAVKNLSSTVPNMMTNQPLLHLYDKASKKHIWEYSPVKYWPNNPNALVTFVAYYPFQDYKEMGSSDGGYYRDGEADEDGDGVTSHDGYNDVDLRCIEPPAKNTNGVNGAAYKFKFTQKPDVTEHIDFLVGIKQNVKKPNVNEVISLDMYHTLCAVWFDLRLEKDLIEYHYNGDQRPTKVRFDVKSIGFEGLYTQGVVYPEISDNNEVTIKWESLGKLDQVGTYMIDFNVEGEKPYGEFGADGKSTEYVYANRQQIYFNWKNRTVKDGKNSNSRGMKYLMLVVPQKAEKEEDNTTAKESFLVVKYDVTYEYSSGSNPHVVKYTDCIEKIQLKDDQKTATSVQGQLFVAGRILTFNVGFRLDGINMSAEMMDWDYDDATTYPDDDAPHEYDTYFGSLVAPTDVTLDLTTLSLTVGGDPATLTATVSPDDAYNKVSWTSSDEAVATVDRYGVVRAVGAGTAIITVTTDYGYKKATCSVTVN